MEEFEKRAPTAAAGPQKILFGDLYGLHGRTPQIQRVPQLVGNQRLPQQDHSTRGNS